MSTTLFPTWAHNSTFQDSGNSSDFFPGASKLELFWLFSTGKYFHVIALCTITTKAILKVHKDQKVMLYTNCMHSALPSLYKAKQSNVLCLKIHSRKKFLQLDARKPYSFYGNPKRNPLSRNEQPKIIEKTAWKFEPISSLLLLGI